MRGKETGWGSNSPAAPEACPGAGQAALPQPATISDSDPTSLQTGAFYSDFTVHVPGCQSWWALGRQGRQTEP